MSKEVIKKLTPSTFKYILDCPCWERKPEPPTAAMRRGTAMDTLLRDYLFTKKDSLTGVSHKELKPRDISAIEWSGNTIRTICGESDILSQKADCKFRFTIDDVLISGEMDAYCPTARFVFDLKSGMVRDYEAQMLPYAYHGMQDTNTDNFVTCLVFCDHRLTKKKIFSRTEAEERMEAFVRRWNDPNKTPTTCYSCRYCRHCSSEGKCMFGVS